MPKGKPAFVDVEEYIENGFRFFGFEPEQVLKMSHREFHILMKGKREKDFDQLEMMSINAIMIRRAYHDRKKIRATDLFKRPNSDHKAMVNKKDIVEEMEKAKSYLAQFEQFNFGEESNPKGGTDSGND